MIMYLILLCAETYIGQNLILPSFIIRSVILKFLYVFHISYIVFFIKLITLINTRER